MKRLQYIVLCGLLLLVAACEKDTLPMNFSPALTTGTASDIFRVGATLSGTIQKSDGVVVKDCGILISELQSMAEYTEIKTSSTENTFDVLAQNLEPGKKYYYCAYASSGYSIARGEIKEFSTTDSNAPVFSELAVENKDEKSFTVATTILDEGGSDLILCGFCWKLVEEDSKEPTVEDKVSNVSAQSSAISTRIKDLTPNKNYLVRAYGINAKGVGYGKTVTVSTNNATVPAVSSINPVDSTALSVSVKASILSAGESTVTEIGFCWSAENQEPTTANMKYDATGQGQAGFTYSIEGLTPETTYYIRAYAVNGQGTGYGDVYTYTTGRATTPGIYSLQDLLDFRDAVNANQPDLWKKMQDANGVIHIYSDIDMSTVDNWIKINQVNSDMTIDGNNHTISNLHMEAFDDNRIGFVGDNYGIIRNLTLSGKMTMTRDVVYDESDVASSSIYNGVFCYNNSGTIQNCHSYVDVSATGKDIEFGGICYQTLGTVENCSNHGSMMAASIAGIAHYVSGKVIDCTNYGTLKSTLAVSDRGYCDIGGTAVSCMDGMISGCVNEGKVLTDGYSSSFGGICATPGRNSVISNCLNKGEVSGGSFTGGIIGSVQFSNVQVTNCQNSGVVTSRLAGGICGAVAYYGAIAPLTDVVVSGNKNIGTITGTDIPGGGICGLLLRIDNTFNFTNNVNGGTVDGIAGTNANIVGQDDRDLPLN